MQIYLIGVDFPFFLLPHSPNIDLLQGFNLMKAQKLVPSAFRYHFWCFLSDPICKPCCYGLNPHYVILKRACWAISCVFCWTYDCGSWIPIFALFTAYSMLVYVLIFERRTSYEVLPPKIFKVIKCLMFSFKLLQSDINLSRKVNFPLFIPGTFVKSQTIS